MSLINGGLLTLCLIPNSWPCLLEKGELVQAKRALILTCGLNNWFGTPEYKRTKASMYGTYNKNEQKNKREKLNDSNEETNYIDELNTLLDNYDEKLDKNKKSADGGGGTNQANPPIDDQRKKEVKDMKQK